MGKPKYDPPTATFPYKISKRLNLLSVPHAYIIDTGEGMPALTPRGIRVSAIHGQATDRITDAAWPYLRRFILTKRAYKTQFSKERLERIDRMIEAANATCYSKLANCVLDLKKQDSKEVKKKKGWSESEWKKHMDYIGQIAGPKKDFKPPPIKRGQSKPLDALLPRINQICSRPDFKVYKRLSQETWYRNPEKVSPNALKYVISDRVKKLAVARVIPVGD
ncbi:testicular haploid expressed gene [Anticarsia gemmatalis]|uniref:testicular haploid expressed gene n=1 Tax=Anticarsia gemmatalis TaxID=129554 RepID=UPI003F75C3F5